LDMAQLVIQRTVKKPNKFGFRVNMIAGSGILVYGRLWAVLQHGDRNRPPL